MYSGDDVIDLIWRLQCPANGNGADILTYLESICTSTGLCFFLSTMVFTGNGVQRELFGLTVGHIEAGTR